MIIVIFRQVFYTAKFADGDVVRISGRIKKEPIIYEYSAMIVIEDLVAFVPLFPEINYGDVVVIEGVVDDGGLKDPEIISITPNKSPLFLYRKRLQSFYHKNLPSPHDALVSGFVLGSKANMPRDFWEELKITGTAHVVVASGMNITLVAGFLMTTLVLFINRKKAVVLALAGIWVYAVLAGFDAPIIRSAIMASIAFVAVMLGRLGNAWRALVLSALIMLIISPSWISDLGFILSFVATGSLMLFSKPIQERLKFVPGIVREDLATSLSATIGVGPILFYTFGYLNVLSPLINTIVLWTVVPVTLIGAVAGILGTVYEPLGSLVLKLVYPMTWWFTKIVEVFSSK